METVYVKARAKVNLTLNILDKREDNYHNLETVFQKISLYDEIYIEKTEKQDEIEIETNVDNLKAEDNIIYKAYKLLKENFKEITGVKVTLKKNIPMQAGLAGGSTDCASFIKGMNKLFDLKLSLEEMINLGVKLGADVPQALFDTPVIGRGIGEKIEKIASNTKYYILVIKPEFSCNTKEMYRKIDEKNEIKQEYNTTNMKKALEDGNIQKIADNLYNIFETEVDEIERIKEEIKSKGAIGSLMAGSGSAVFGIFRNKKEAKEGYRKLSKKYKTYYCLSYIR